MGKAQQNEVDPVDCQAISSPGSASVAYGPRSPSHMNERVERISIAIKQTGLRVIVAAGMPRSGSTWQFNALRLLLESSGQGIYSFWIEDWDSEKARHAQSLLVKIHEISPMLAWASWRCFTCHRDLRDIAVSAADLARADGYKVDIVPMMQETRKAHEFWRRVSVLDIPYEQVVADPEAILKELEAFIEISIAEVEVQHICQSLKSLSDGDAPSGSPHNPVTLLHRKHFFDGTSGRYRGVLDDETEQRIIDENETWMSEFGYI